MKYRKVGVIHFVKVGRVFVSFGIGRSRSIPHAPSAPSFTEVARVVSIVLGAGISLGTLFLVAAHAVGGF